ncbi:MAG: DUF2207 domain-containing protein [Deferribacteres bacterium]|nr:DUF2207 domain-containing protein [Deferribacteres bacterium]
MKRLWLLSLIVISLTAPLHAKLTIEKADISAVLDENGYLIVTERYNVNFLTPHHGIYRNIPLYFYDYSTRQKRRIKIEGIYPKDCKGGEVPFHTKYARGYIYIYMGDPKRKITGRKCYELTYRVDGIIGEYNGYQILGYNFVGSGWDTYLNNVNISIMLPEKMKPQRLSCFWKRRTPCPYRDGGWFFDRIPPHTPVTIWVMWKHPHLPERIYRGGIGYLQMALGFTPVAIPVLWLLFLFAYWREKGKDPKLSRSEMVFYRPPTEITPLEAGVLIDFKLDAKDIAAALVNLAVKGYVKIVQLAKPFMFGFGGDYRIEVLKDISVKDKNINYDELVVVQKLFGTPEIPAGRSVKLSQLKKETEKIRSLYETLETVINERLKRAGYLSKGPQDYAWIKVASFAVVFTTIGLSIIISDRISATTGEELMIMGIPMPIIAYALAFTTAVLSPFIMRAMAKRTRKGAELVWKLRGFMEFVDKVEIKKLKELFPPEKYPVVFERYFPYAMALGVADKWARKFEPLLSEINYSSGWYMGSSRFRASSFATSFASSIKSSTGRGGIGGAGGGAGGGGGGGW